MMDKELITRYYAQGLERDRLTHPLFLLEGLRTKNIIQRYLTNKPLTIADIGGGTGFYSFWLASLGHKLTLIDLSPENIHLAQTEATKSGISLSKMEAGDATKLSLDNDQFDVVLLLGPLYHLTEREDRLRALREAKRILKPDGVLLCAAISRYASLFDGFKRDLVFDPAFRTLLRNDLETGIHKNESENPEYFTTAYFHKPEELREEIKDAGLGLKTLIAIEGFGWIIDNFEQKIADKTYMSWLEETLRLTESNDDLLAMSQHFMGVAAKERYSEYRPNK